MAWRFGGGLVLLFAPGQLIVTGAFSAAVVAVIYPGPKGVVTRRRGVVPILLWVAFVLVQAQARGAI
ncbi:MAG: hypothetical protein FJX37_10650 [Alphaproteobacteria bacterium]|nr:hypothetical protein [Alphaproteobacteria bacterium]MBM3950978.1 hypothetical protein [Rhodospirillales bacterium]